MIVRGIVRAVKESTSIQSLKVESYADDTREDVERFHQFGFKSYAPIGSEVVMLSISGSNEHFIAIASENRDTLKLIPALADGDSIFYNKSAKYLHLKGDNLEGLVDKMKIENSSEELITILSDLIQQIRDSKWNTAIGPQPIFESDGVLLDDIKTRLDTFKI